MSLDSKEEAIYRLELTEGYLERAEKAFARRDFADTVAEAQLSVENAAKAVISCFQIPSWSHDPSEELLDIVKNNQPKIAELLGSEFLKRLERLAERVHIIAPEHGRASYGDIERRIPPWRIYSEEDAQRALEYAREACTTAKSFIKAWCI